MNTIEEFKKEQIDSLTKHETFDKYNIGTVLCTTEYIKVIIDSAVQITEQRITGVIEEQIKDCEYIETMGAFNLMATDWRAMKDLIVLKLSATTQEKEVKEEPTEEICPHCGEVVNIPANQPSRCSNCGIDILPCSACTIVNECDWNKKIGCKRFPNKKEPEYCEWGITDNRERTRYLTSCGYSTTFRNETNICNYCGKPIKIREEKQRIQGDSGKLS